MLKRYNFRQYDIKLVILMIAVSILGILVIGSARESYQLKQIVGLLISCTAILVVSLIDYSYILNYYWLFYVLNIVLLLSVRFFGVRVNGAKRWVVILGIQFQPSETAKILLILFFAAFIMKHEETLNTFKTIVQICLLLALPLFLIYDQPDMSTTIVLACIIAVILFVAGLSYKVIGGFLAVAIPSFVIFLSILLQPGSELLNDYQRNRILAFLQPEKYETAEGYQQANSVMAIGSGMLTGKGLNNNVIGSVKNGNFISEPHTDFIFTIAGEELGFIGCCAIILLIFLIAVECVLIGRRAKDTAGMLICAGMAAWIGLQSFFNIGVATRILPNTGLTLPFVSYGLTSLVSIFIGMGVVLNVGLQSKKY